MELVEWQKRKAAFVKKAQGRMVERTNRGIHDGEPMFFFVQEEMIMSLFEELEKIQSVMDIPDEQPKDL